MNNTPDDLYGLEDKFSSQVNPVGGVQNQAPTPDEIKQGKLSAVKSRIDPNNQLGTDLDALLAKKNPQELDNFLALKKEKKVYIKVGGKKFQLHESKEGEENMDLLKLLAKEFNFKYASPKKGYIEALYWGVQPFEFSELSNFREIGTENKYKVSFEVPQNKLGGVIVFSTDVNAIDLFDNELKNTLTSVWMTIKNRLLANKKLYKIMVGLNLTETGYTIGSFFKGKYIDDKNRVFSEKSKSLEITNIPFEVLCTVAAEVARQFAQQTVLVKEHGGSNRILFIKALGKYYDVQ